ncbi:40S ribosomal protein S4, X isoform [Reticulomyxa filosa]|uniref:40S ribosomal protein S4, X isoform n=1 Tax=Reticulomyxa filosa TaxID=46433 RepID=X6NGE1_RETFI|nr:40S ribosomal protein S4, X isoform [Reticulomyxa filosa]|eukprot:ETO24963.1 40S ribosomal protein S4, X isoform [Reticulomyxa filosa]
MLVCLYCLQWKLCKIVKKAVGARGIPYVVTHDGRTIPYPNPRIKVGDTIKYDFFKGKMMDLFEWRTGVIVMVIGGRNVGRVGILEKLEKHPGSFDIVHVKDSAGNEFATRRENLFVLGKGTKPAVRLPPGKGVKLDVVTDRDIRLSKIAKPKHNQNEKKVYVGTRYAKKTILPPRVDALRKKTREKTRLLRLLKEQERKASANKPKVAKKKKEAKKKPEAAPAEAAKPAEE